MKRKVIQRRITSIKIVSVEFIWVDDADTPEAAPNADRLLAASDREFIQRDPPVEEDGEQTS